jgi:hypothetical protein
MPRYQFRFDVVESYSCSFTAESREQAEELYRQVQDGEINTDELPEYLEKNSGIDTELYELENGYGAE